MQLIGIKIDVETWKIAEDREKGRKIVGRRGGKGKRNMEEKEQTERKEKILEDWTWKQRRMRWKLEEIARMEERKENQVWIEYGKIRIKDQWWSWDEEEEILIDRKSNRKNREREEGEEREKEKGG